MALFPRPSHRSPPRPQSRTFRARSCPRLTTWSHRHARSWCNVGADSWSGWAAPRSTGYVTSGAGSVTGSSSRSSGRLCRRPVQTRGWPGSVWRRRR